MNFLLAFVFNKIRKSMKKILVIGATGSCGAYTALGLKEKGFDVVAVAHRKSDNGFLRRKEFLTILLI